MAKNLLEKFSALAAVLVKEPRLHEPKLRGGAAIKWHRMVNREAALGQGRGLVAEAPCKHCVGGYKSMTCLMSVLCCSIDRVAAAVTVTIIAVEHTATWC